MSYVFLATPYRSFPGSLDDAWEASVQAMIPFRRAKISVISPIALYHPVAMQAGLDPHEMAWAEMNKPILLNAKAMVVAHIAGFDKSEGIFVERNIAAENTIPVFGAPPGVVPLEVVKLFTKDDENELAVVRLANSDQPESDFNPRPWLENAPHYKTDEHDIRDVIEAFDLNFNLGYAVSRIVRKKPGNSKLMDLKKAQVHIEREIAREMRKKGD